MSLFTSASLILTPNGYKSGKLYSIVPSTGDGDLACVRATTATRVNSSGLIENVGMDVPRLDHSDGIASWLLEPQRTNLLTYSSTFTDASWYRVSMAAVLDLTVVSPDGSLNAYKESRNSVSANSYVIKGTTSPAGTVYTATIYAKLGNVSTNFGLRVSGPYPKRGDALFNLSTGTLIGVENGNTNTNTTGSITPVGNGWYRCSVTTTFASSITAPEILYSPTALTSIGAFEAVDDALSNCYVWGAQLESGSYATSYIPTTTSTVTRNVDVISKIGISELIGQTEGTVFVDYIWNNNNDVDVIPISIRGDLGKLILFRRNGVQFYGNGTSLIFNTWTNPVQNTRYKLAFVYGQNYFKLFIDGFLIGQVLIGTFSGNFSEIIFNEYAGQSPFDSSIKHNSFQLYKTKLSDAECIALTTP